MKYVLAILLAFCGLTSWAEGIWNDVFNWEASLTLTPPYSPATAQNRSGATIGGVEFKGKYSTFTIDDSAIKEKSQSARFYFGYLTQTNEMRAYASSVITVKVAENQSILGIGFEGAKVGADYLYTETPGTWTDGVWTPAQQGVFEVRFEVLATINCTKTTINGTEWNSVDDISINAEGETVSWTDMQGRTYTHRPQAAGIYICRYASGKVTRSLIK